MLFFFSDSEFRAYRWGARNQYSAHHRNRSNRRSYFPRFAGWNIGEYSQLKFAINSNCKEPGNYQCPILREKKSKKKVHQLFFIILQYLVQTIYIIRYNYANSEAIRGSSSRTSGDDVMESRCPLKNNFDYPLKNVRYDVFKNRNNSKF